MANLCEFLNINTAAIEHADWVASTAMQISGMHPDDVEQLYDGIEFDCCVKRDTDISEMIISELFQRTAEEIRNNYPEMQVTYSVNGMRSEMTIDGEIIR